MQVQFQQKRTDGRKAQSGLLQMREGEPDKPDVLQIGQHRHGDIAEA
jgi:hypothetical protein